MLAVDLARSASGIEAIGYLNLIFVWALMQQLGFFVAEGIRLGKAVLLTSFGLSLGALLLGAVLGFWPLDMLQNLNPPRFPLLLLGVAQLALMELLRPRLQAAVERPSVRRVSDFANAKSLTIYLWHASVMAALIGGMLILGMPMPEPLSPAWWASRVIWLLALLVALIPAVAYLSRFEKLPGNLNAAQPPRHAATATALAVTAVVLVLALGASPVAWMLASVALTTAVGLVSANSRTAGLRPRSFSKETWWPASRRAILS